MTPKQHKTSARVHDRMLDNRAARALVRRDIANLKLSHIRELKLDEGCTGYTAVFAEPGSDWKHVHWHNALHGFGRRTYYRACLKRYSKESVIRSFGSYEWGTVEIQCIAQALARGHRLELEWQAACGNAKAAKQLGLAPGTISSRKCRLGVSGVHKKSHPKVPFLGRGVSLFSVAGLTQKQAVERIGDTVDELIRSGRRVR